MSILRFLPLIPFLAVILAPGAGIAADCAECHQDWILKGKALANVHSPFADGDCSSCHAEHGDAKKLVLASAKSKLCLDCHDDPAEGGKKVHPALEDGCTDCHNPHASANKKLLVKTGNPLCLDCHDDPAAQGTPHEAVSDGACLDCHVPHSSKQAKLLTQPVTKLCGDCHDMVPEGNTLHTAMDDGCTSCHDPHTTPAGFENLLRKTYKNEKTVKTFDLKDYGICWECHETSLVTGKAEEKTTGFRTSKKNLHDIHVAGPIKSSKYGIIKRGKPHSCGVCHGPHSADQEFILIRKYDCGEVFCFTLNFTPLTNGGGCRVGCHKPMGYDRNGDIIEVGGSVSATEPVAPKTP